MLFIFFFINLNKINIYFYIEKKTQYSTVYPPVCIQYKYVLLFCSRGQLFTVELKQKSKSFQIKAADQ